MPTTGKRREGRLPLQVSPLPLYEPSTPTRIPHEPIALHMLRLARSDGDHGGYNRISFRREARAIALEASLALNLLGVAEVRCIGDVPQQECVPIRVATGSGHVANLTDDRFDAPVGCPRRVDETRRRHIGPESIGEGTTDRACVRRLRHDARIASAVWWGRELHPQRDFAGDDILKRRRGRPLRGRERAWCRCRWLRRGLRLTRDRSGLARSFTRDHSEQHRKHRRVGCRVAAHASYDARS